MIEVFISGKQFMRSFALFASVAFINCVTVISVHAASDIQAFDTGLAADKFAKETFSTFYTLPRSKDVMKAIPDLLHDEDAWQAFLQRNYAAPNLSLATLKDLTATYTFPDAKPDVKITKNAVVVSFAAIQEVRVFGRLAGQNCYASVMYLDMPKGVDDPRGATVKDVLMIMEPMDHGECKLTKSK
nr:hypothetical protein [Neorhizobium tomejilense]